MHAFSSIHTKPIWQQNKTIYFLWVDQFFIQQWKCIECKWTERNSLCFSATLLVWKGLYTAFDQNKAFFKHNIFFFISQCVLRRRSEIMRLKVWSYLHFTLNAFGKFIPNDLHWDLVVRMISSHIPWNSFSSTMLYFLSFAEQIWQQKDFLTFSVSNIMPSLNSKDFFSLLILANT